MKVKEDDSEDDNLSESTTNVDHSDWLCGGPLGGKGTVLVFRSCVLAPKEKSYSYSSNTISGLNSIVKKPAQTCDKTIPESKLDDVTDVSNEVTNGDLTDASIADSDCSTDSSADTSKSINPKDGVEPKRKRDIRDVLNDINNITLKRRLDINNSTAVKPNSIKKSPQSDEENISQETLSTRSSHSSVLNEHNENKQPEKSILESPLGSSSKFPIIQSPVISHTPNVSLSFDSTFSEIYNKEYKDIKMLERNEMPASLLDLKYKTIMTETKLLNRILQAHGLSECPSHSKDYVLLWTGLHPKPDLLKSLCSYQRVNHFPRSYELTRKDKLFKNIEKMQHFRGAKNFDFVPMTFLMPVEYKELCSAHYRTKGPWIIKPAASSRGRGIYIVNAPDKIPKGESVVVAKYIDKPLLVDGHKCDLRLYVCVTSFDPLLIYMYEEGLVRFATVKYDKTNKNLWNPCMHLCNYSINKYHSDYIKCEDPSAENVGHKWTLSALLRHLRRQGRDTGALMTAIEDVVVKSIFSCTQSIACASRMFVPHFSNCFELYGFDILIDDTLKPWLLEINLSPSLGCDSPLDARLKSSLVADTLTLVGVPAYSPTIKTETATNTPSNSNQTSAKPVNLKMRIVGCHRVHSAENMPFGMKKGFTNGIQANGISFLTNDELRIIKLVKAQYQRRGGYVRIFPSQDSWQKYAQYLDPVTGIPVCNTTITNTMDPHALVPHNYNLLVHSQVLPHFDQTMINSSSSDPPERLMRYERVLPVCPRVSLEAYNTAGPSRVGSASKTHFDSKTAKQHIKSQLEQGMHLTLGESRRAFGMFLNLVLKRISNSKSEQSAHHAELIHRFLKRAANTLKMPYNLKNPSQRMHDKDKAAMIAKQLSDFLYLYHRETDMCTSSADQRYCVSNIHFAQFIYGASEIDLEDILLMVLKAEGNVAPFLGDRQSPFCIDIPPSAITRQPGKSVPVKNNQLLRYLTYITPLHSRRFRAPSPEPNSLSLPALDNENATESEPVSLEESVE